VTLCVHALCSLFSDGVCEPYPSFSPASSIVLLYLVIKVSLYDYPCLQYGTSATHAPDKPTI
jgi:hypothetical protein